MVRVKAKNQSAYETHFPKVKVIYAERKYWVVRNYVEDREYLQHYITCQPSLECIEAWFEGAVKGICKPATMCGKVCITQYAVELNNEKGFVEQLNVFETYEEAEEFQKNYEKPLSDGEYLNIIYIDYDENGDEIGFGICSEERSSYVLSI